ncbi:MAG: glycerol-3-phosphate dehydrogenase/oxidase [Candidatus Dormibacteraeota bacterium]|nr:glycerol-3-phosphate dehydrogenase/oxidase [Candidatus Dormibacteraeota bacterium]
MATALEERAAALERLRSETFDLMVVGAGIIGARVALEAALTGARVALVEARDFGGATSSASSKLVHGGLRYLQLYDFALVREAHRERRMLQERLAPHLVRPLTFLLPVFRGAPHGAPTVAAGMLTYAALSGFRHSGISMVGASGARQLVPSLRTERLVAAAVFQDAQTHDSRLVLATVAAAKRAGAVVANHLPITGLETAGGRLAAGCAGDLLIRSRAVVNAAGPWVDQVRRLEDPAAEPMARLSKGVHVVLDLPAEHWGAALTTPLPGGRVTFAAPWEGMLLLGTTDTEYSGDPGLVRAEPEEVRTVLGEAAVALPAQVLARDRVRYSFAGLRVLPRGGGSTARTHREELMETGPAGMVSVAGGKLTTHRQIAVRVLRRLEAFRGARPTSDPLPGAGPLPPRPASVPPETWSHLTHLYGTEVLEVLGGGDGTPIHPSGPDVWAQVEYAVDREWALTVEDVLRRRTTVEVRGLATPEVRQAVAATLGERGVFKTVDES